MELNKKGWGTLQMFLLSGGILLALLVAVYFISKLYGSFDIATGNKQYADLEANLSSAAKKYIYENNIVIDGEFTIYSDTLEALNYINNFKDENGNACSGYVVVSKVNLTNDYKTYISCKNYTTKKY